MNLQNFGCNFERHEKFTNFDLLWLPFECVAFWIDFVNLFLNQFFLWLLGLFLFKFFTAQFFYSFFFVRFWLFSCSIPTFIPASLVWFLVFLLDIFPQFFSFDCRLSRVACQSNKTIAVQYLLTFRVSVSFSIQFFFCLRIFVYDTNFCVYLSLLCLVTLFTVLEFKPLFEL